MASTPQAHPPTILQLLLLLGTLISGLTALMLAVEAQSASAIAMLATAGALAMLLRQERQRRRTAGPSDLPPQT